jgi:molecular chaperone DnaK (HSP70)
MALAFGIDLGTTYSAIARIDQNEQPEIIRNNPDSSDEMDSAVYFPEDGGIVVGATAKAEEELNGDRVVRFIKREIGGSVAAQRRTFNGEEYHAVDISARILKKIADYAEAQGHKVRYDSDEGVPDEEKNGVVITCPAYFGIPEKDATRQAGKIAGMRVLDILDEPVAAAFEHFKMGSTGVMLQNQTILVFDLGGGTFDVAILTVSNADNPPIKVKDSDGNKFLGGKDWDDALTDFILSAYCDQYQLSKDDADVELKWVIRSKVEELKIRLSESPNGRIRFSYDGNRFDQTVTQAQFNTMTQSLLTQTIQKTKDLLDRNNLDVGDINIVLLVGGSTKMPAVRTEIKTMFGEDKVIEGNPNLDVAKGAARCAHQLINGNLSPAETLVPRSFGPYIRVEELGTKMIHNILFKGDPSPTTVEEEYGTAADNMRLLRIPMYQNTVLRNSDSDEPVYVEATDTVHEAEELGVLEFDLPPGLPKDSPIKVKIVAESSKVTAEATVVATGETKGMPLVTKSVYRAEEETELTRRIENEQIVSDETDIVPFADMPKVETQESLQAEPSDWEDD